MPEYIEREAVHRLVRSLTRYAWSSPDKSKYRTTVDIDDVQFGIDKIPTADVVEVRHGKWNGDYCGVCGLAWNADICMGADDDGYFDPMPSYCLNCGAKMDGDVE